MNKERKKVMFITGSLTGGGAEKVMSILANTCAEKISNVSLVSIWEKEIAYNVSDKVNFVQIKSTKSKFEVFQRISKLRKIIKDNNPDVLVPFLPIISLYTLFASFGLKKKIIMSERADPAGKLFVKNRNKKDLIGNLLMNKLQLFILADYMVFQTPDAQSYYNKKIQKKSSVIPNPLDNSSLPNVHIGMREKTVVAIGRLTEVKNFPLLINTFADFYKSNPEYTLNIFGEGKERGNLQNLIDEFNLNHCVKLKGFHPNVTEELCKATMFVSVSNHEGISNVMLEALGMGVPTIVTDCPVGGARMFVRTDENGILIPTNDSVALLNAMNKIISDKDYANKISQNALKIREEISSENICDKWLEIINKV